jgi:hypothetical protein
MSNFKDGVSVILAGTSKWAKVTEATGPNDLSEKYQLDLYLDDASAASIKGLGAESILKDKGEGVYITAKSKLLPKVFDANRQAFTGRIGNGSLLRVKVLIKEWEALKKKGITAYLNGIVIVKLEEYNSLGDDALFEGLEPTATQDAPDSDGLPF